MVFAYLKRLMWRPANAKLVPKRAWARSLAVEFLEARTLLSTVHNFDMFAAGSPFTFQHLGEPPAAQILAGGPTGNGQYIRLSSGNALAPDTSNQNTIAFNRTDIGAFGVIV